MAARIMQAITATTIIVFTAKQQQTHVKSNESLPSNSITLSGSKLVRSRSPTSFEPASVMELGFYCHDIKKHSHQRINLNSDFNMLDCAVGLFVTC